MGFRRPYGRAIHTRSWMSENQRRSEQESNGVVELCQLRRKKIDEGGRNHLTASAALLVTRFAALYVRHAAVQSWRNKATADCCDMVVLCLSKVSIMLCSVPSIS